jgi:hypothetical protein
MLKQISTNYGYVQNYMLCTCIIINFLWSTSTPNQFDFDLITKIHEASLKTGNAKDVIPFSSCGNPSYSTGEKENKIGLFFLIICHIFMGQFISKLDRYKIGFQGSFRSLRINSNMEEFESSKMSYIILSTVAWLVFGAVAIFLNVAFGAVSVNTFPPECKAYSEKKFGVDGLFNKSMINIWIITDILICLLTMPCLTLNYYLDKKLEENQWLELLVHCQSNALKKFYANDEVAKAKAEERTLTNKLTTRILSK